MNLRRSLAAALLLVPAAAAQTYYFMPSDTPNAGTCNVICWGTDRTAATWVNQRYQTLVPNADLGNDNIPKRISSLAFAPCGIQTHQGDTLQITMAVTNATTLDTTFANNLTTNAQVVFQGTCHIRPMAADAWNNVGLQRPYLFLPPQGANLVVDILVTGNHRLAGSGTGFHRTDNRQRVFAISWTGTPPATGSTDQAALKMRLGVDESAIDLYGTGCGRGPLSIGATGSAKPASSVSITVTNGPSPGAGIVWLGFGILPVTVDLSAAGLTGCKLWVPLDIPVGVAFVNGTSTPVALPIPNDSSLVSSRFYAQSLAVDAASPGGLVLSDYVRFLIGK